MFHRQNKRGFTLVELLVAGVVTGIILTAVVTLSYAASSASRLGSDNSRCQAQLRFSTLGISELVRYCNLICGDTGSDIVIWRADDNNDGKINISEVVYIEKGPDSNYLSLCEFRPASAAMDGFLEIAELGDEAKKQWLKNNSTEVNTVLISQCSNVQFVTDSATPWCRFVNISFDMTENSVVSHYQINAVRRCGADHLLDESGNLVLVDDDKL